MNIIIQAYNLEWAAEFDRVRKHLLRILKDIPILSIEHVGSTSILGLAAKQILDIDIVVVPEILAATTDALSAAGYTNLGELFVPGRIAFRQPGFERSQPGSGIQ
ncbi:hypothetical protein L207DRAFT_587419 [Hyaloscypha variabilis F]|jgi:GrpB-like predicted nucleotidyltransferase (UPF0157 family)|uniref:Uncharacterized protein n=1 Tax=Hyaloscypha variabilis (strain UAMH 11265 / GT02V1 / F) TaxID=1149755 RepID=A0A2J6RD27_HYAVF|nr:hypothetical protein L207DRAFT_587419 [Hyaloscypha variabilis F]